MRKFNHEEMAKGYEEMGAINLAICEEFFHLETEGEQVSEMDTAKSQGEAQ